MKKRIKDETRESRIQKSNTGKISTKKRITSPAKLPNSAKIVIGVLFLLLLILCFIHMGFLFTIGVAIFGLIIVGIAKLIDKVGNNKKKKLILNIILIIMLAMGILMIVLFGIFMLYITIKAPEFDTKKLNTSEVTIIYDKDGNQIAKLGSEMREKVKYEQLPQVLVDAIVATEDSRFYQHNGFDVPRFTKAAFGQLLGHSSAGGASTLSMQVIKNSFTSTESHGVEGIIRKFTDIYLAVFKLEKNYSKEDIIEFYVNNHFLGGNIYGVQEAARGYFGKDVSDLNLAEASVLAGMFKSPNYYRPNYNPKNATARRSTVLHLMKIHGYITKEQEELANSIPVESLVTEQASKTASPYQSYIDTVADEIDEEYGLNIYTAPLLIYTNLDRSKQDGINDVLAGNTYSWVDDKIQAGVSVIDSATGKILAIGGGRNKNGDLDTFNYATEIERQPGSTAKPLFDYGPGIEFNNWSTYTLFDDAPYSYSDGTPIHNWDNRYYGTVTMRRALSTSRNIPALKAFQQIDNSKIVDFVTSLGIKPEIAKNGRIHEAHAIGSFTGVSPLQMSAAYAAFSNGGYYNKPYTVNKIVFRDTGKEEEHKSTKKQVMSDATAYMISSILQDVQISGKTIPNVAAKTGTTNYDEATRTKYNFPADTVRDSWVIGFTTKTVIGMWYGYDKIESGYYLRTIPATVQKDKLFVSLANAAFEKDKAEFKMPDSVVKLGIIPGSNPPQMAGEGYTGDLVYEYFKKDAQPKEVKKVEKLATPGNLKAVYSNGKVSLTWSAVSKLNGDENYGTFGYNVYQGNTLLGFSEGTSYSFNTSNPYTTYRVVATYKSYSGAQSDAASFTLKEEKKEETTELDCKTNTFTPGREIPTACDFSINGSIMSSAIVSVISNSCMTNESANAVESSTTTFPNNATSCTVTYSIKYNSDTYKATKTYGAQ